MLFAVHFMADKRMTASTTTGPLMLGFMLAAVLYGGANINPIGINPARDFGPRLFILMAGWRDTFSAYNYYFYIPLLSPIVGGIAAQGLYDYLMIPTSIKRKEDRVGHH
ncbi:hypothetical protein FBU59_003651 [Linderina macrospora]|uniref:Uncharacterized protein n=1 Tax=Linderina macrospora TaxID=4868 RepID=A0ACC1J7V5_9FUNG|nr:hypothetical protein FBU59_003651 [Linderina macrospora]